MPGCRVLPKHPQHPARHHAGAWLANASAGHAGVRALDHDRDAARLERGLDRVGNLRGHPLLYLQTMREDFHDPREFRKTYDARAREITDATLRDVRAALGLFTLN